MQTEPSKQLPKFSYVSLNLPDYDNEELGGVNGTVGVVLDQLGAHAMVDWGTSEAGQLVQSHLRGEGVFVDCLKPADSVPVDLVDKYSGTVFCQDFQKDVERTLADQLQAYRRIAENVGRYMRLIHFLIGSIGELGEIATDVEREIWYGQAGAIDDSETLLEFGDLSFYHSEGLTGIGRTLDECLRANRAKREKRYPVEFDQERAKEENRDRNAEREAGEAAATPRIQSTTNHSGLEPEYVAALQRCANKAITTGGWTYEAQGDVLVLTAPLLSWYRGRATQWFEIELMDENGDVPLITRVPQYVLEAFPDAAKG